MTTSTAHRTATAQIAGTSTTVRFPGTEELEQAGPVGASSGVGYRVGAAIGVLLAGLLLLAPVAGTLSAALRDGDSFSVPAPSPGPPPSPAPHP